MVIHIERYGYGNLMWSVKTIWYINVFWFKYRMGDINNINQDTQSILCAIIQPLTMITNTNTNTNTKHNKYVGDLSPSPQSNDHT